MQSSFTINVIVVVMAIVVVMVLRVVMVVVMIVLIVVLVMVMMILIMRSIPPADTAEVVLPPPLSFCRQRAPLKSPIIQTPTQHVSISGAIEVHLGVL